MTVATNEPAVAVPAGGRLRRVIWPVLGAGALVAATVYVARVDPNGSGGYPPCPLKAMTGLDCPGCGGLRCVHALTQGDIATAADQNLLALIILPIAAAWMIMTIVSRVRGNTEPVSFIGSNPRLTNIFWFSMIGVMLVYTIIRNLPFGWYLHSGVG